MAASFSRSDPTSPSSVADASFSTARKGYSPDEVRGFLAAVSAELRRAQERERELIAELHDVQSRPATDAELDDETAAKLLGEETLRVLHTARESASEIKIRAEEQAARIMRDAHDEVNRLRQEAEVEAARRRQDATSDAEAEVALAKQQGREMVNEARAYRERVLADLDRRTNLARKQIEELAHGRDRLLQVFERARLVAVDVTGSLQAIEGPAEVVNLAPTTGPVPLMVPAGASSPAGSATDETDHADRADETAVDALVDAEPGAGVDTNTDVDDADTEADAIDADHTDAEDTDVDHEVEVETASEPATETVIEDDHVDDDDGDGDGDDGDGDDDDGGDGGPDGHDGPDDQPESATDQHHEDDDGDDDEEDDGGDGDGDNVVSLFPSADGDDGDADSDDDASVRADPVDDIFAKLRAADANEATDAPTPPPADATDLAADVAADEERVATADEVADTPFARRDEALAPLATAGARRLKRVLADEQNEVLDTLRRGDPVDGVAALVGDPSEQLERYLSALDDQLGGAAAAGAGELGAADTPTLRATLHGAGALDGAKATITGSIVEPLRERLETAVTDAGDDHDDLTIAIRAIYREWKTQQIDAHLDDVLRAAYAGAISAGIEPGTATVWVCDPNGPSCPDGEDNSLAGEVTVGEPFPTGHQSAPAHAGCRCLTLPASR